MLSNPHKRASYDLERKKKGTTSQTPNQTANPTASSPPHWAGTGSTTTQTAQSTVTPIYAVQYVRDIKSLKPWFIALGFLTLLHACQGEQTNTNKVTKNQNYTPPAPVVTMQKQEAYVPTPPTAPPILDIPVQTAAQFSPQPVNGIYNWDSEHDGHPKTYNIDGYTLVLESRQGKDDSFVPVMNVVKLGMPNIELIGQPTNNSASASFAVTKLDPSSDDKQIIFLSYSGGAHCCTSVTVVEKRGLEWKKLELGSWDGGVFTELPKDIDGDGIPDLVFRDGAFNYKFSSYADGFAPPKIFNILNGEAVDVSNSPRYEQFYRKEMEPAKQACLRHNNGGCAGYVAMAARIGEYAIAWPTMIQNFDRTSDWGLDPLCLTQKVNGVCPPGMSGIKPQFPLALNIFLRETHYISDAPSFPAISEAPIAPPVTVGPVNDVTFAAPASPEIANSDTKPSFDCSKVHSDVLLLVCSTPKLAAADQELAKAYSATLAVSANPNSIRQSELEWIKERNNSEPNVVSLSKLYCDRIEELHNLR